MNRHRTHRGSDRRDRQTHDQIAESAAARRMVALARMLVGSDGDDLAWPAPVISAGFENTADGAQRVHRAACADRREAIHLAFERAHPERPAGLWVADRGDYGTSLHSRVVPWMPSDGGPTILLSQSMGRDQVRFVVHRDAGIERRDGWPEDLDDGIERAAREWDRLTLAASAQMASAAVRRLRHLGSADGPHLRLGPPSSAPEARTLPGRAGAPWPWPADDRDAGDEAVCRAICGADLIVPRVMMAFAAGLSLGLTGGTETVRPEPLIQAGFDPTDRAEKRQLVRAAVRARCDLIQVCFDPGEPNQPTQVLLIHRDRDGARLYARLTPWAIAGGGRGSIILVSHYGARCHFIVHSRRAIERLDGWPADDLAPGVARAYALWNQLAESAQAQEGLVSPLLRHVRADGAGALFSERQRRSVP